MYSFSELLLKKWFTYFLFQTVCVVSLVELLNSLGLNVFRIENLVFFNIAVSIHLINLRLYQCPFRKLVSSH